MENETGTEIKPLILEPGATFIANGKTYTVTEDITIGRLQKVEELEQEAFALSQTRDWHTLGRLILQRINNNEPGMVHTLVYNKMEADLKSAKVAHYLTRVVCAYINWNGEDVRYLTDETIKVKMDDFAGEGYSAAPFLLLAVRLCRGLFESYKVPILSILEEAENLKTALGKVLDIRTSIKIPDSGAAMPPAS